MRRFKIENAKGEVFDLMRTDAFFHSPAGLGFSVSIETVEAGLSFLPISRQNDAPVISGEMVFLGYEQYREFVRFLTPQIKFWYNPLGTWYCAEGSAAALDKTEIDSDTNRLVCAVTFQLYSQWYVPATFEQTQPGEDGGKVYTYAYPYTYIGGEPGVIQISNMSTENAPCRLYIMGACVNPRWEVIQGGEVAARGQVNATIQAGRKLFVSSLASELQISEVSLDNTFIQDLYQASDFSTGRFIYLPPGEASLTVSDESGAQMVAYVEVLQFAATV